VANRDDIIKYYLKIIYNRKIIKRRSYNHNTTDDWLEKVYEKTQQDYHHQQLCNCHVLTSGLITSKSQILYQKFKTS